MRYGKTIINYDSEGIWKGLVLFSIRVQITARRPAILSESSRGFPHTLLANAGIVS
jgi:hypothetical protein